MSEDSNNPATEDTHSEMYCPLCDQSYVDSAARHCPVDGTKLVRLSQSGDRLIGVQLDGRFTIREKLGAGGMGTVYRAWQASVGREVAVKVIEARYADNRHAAKRFLREAKLASRLSQPNTVGVIDFGQTDDGMLFLVMELVKGKTLDEVLRTDGVFDARRTVRIGVQLCDALDAAHALKIVHRDLKPANIIILDDPPGRDLIKVLDFGLAKTIVDEDSTSVTHSDVVVGTPSYIAPEIVEGASPDQRTDLYSVGVILYELATGRRPFVADSVSQMFAMHVHDPAPRPEGVPADLERAIMKLLEKRPEDRFANAAEARAALVTAGETSRNHPAVAAPVKVGNVTGVETTATSIDRPTSLTPSPKVDTVEPEPRRSSRLGIALALLVVVGGIVSLGVAMGWFDSGAGSDKQAATPPAADAAPPAQDKAPPPRPVTTKPSPDASPPATKPAPAATVTIVLKAKPRATVFLDGKRLGLSPQTATLTKDGSTHRVGFRRSGHYVRMKTFRADGPKTISVTLRRAATRPTMRPDPEPKTKPDNGTIYLDPDKQ